jgi:hypothetical protein
MKQKSRKIITALFCSVALCSNAYGLGGVRYVRTTDHPGDFVIVKEKQCAKLYVDAADYAGVRRAANDLQTDIKRVSDCTVPMAHEGDHLGPRVIMVGTLGKSSVIDRLVRDGKIDTGRIAGEWEAFSIQTVANPLPGISAALVIVGSDKRGTIYGVYDLSEQIGVSPWFWWADVPVRHQDSLAV